MVLSLGIVCAVLFMVVRLLKRSGVAGKVFSSGGEIRLLATQSIAPQKYISLVEIGGEVLALGISETQITLLTKVENREFVERVLSDPLSKPQSLNLFQYFQHLPPNQKGLKSAFLRKLHGK
jgi:flagellar biogenesis protein FliO